MTIKNKILFNNSLQGFPFVEKQKRERVLDGNIRFMYSPIKIRITKKNKNENKI